MDHANMNPHDSSLSDSSLDDDQIEFLNHGPKPFFASEEGTSESEDTTDHESEEIESDPEEEDFKIDLRDCLDSVEHSGTFSSSATTGLYVNPGLRVESIGTIGLPLSTRDALSIASVCKQSPFGKGDETVIDESVRKTWELNTNEFKCCNPAWQPFLDKLTQHAFKDLGLQVAAIARPYKLLLYEEGAFFKAHRDTEKVPGMFGTLVICLPSEHTGGEVQLVHNGKRISIGTAPMSAYNVSALAWYSDVQHEIKAVTSGYRLVLTYNLVQDQSLPKQTAAALDASAAQLTKLLGTWDSHFQHLDWFAYPLEHMYTPASLSLKNLKGQDAAKGRYLDQLCAKNDVYWFLAKMTKETQEEDFGDDDIDAIRLSDIVTPNGKTVYLNLEDVNEERILADTDYLYGERDADSEDEGEYTGNENMPSTCRYHNTVAIIMRKVEAISKYVLIDQHASSLENMFDLVSNDRYCLPTLRLHAMGMLMRKCIHMIGRQLNGWDNDSYRSSTYGGYGGAYSEQKGGDYASVFATISSFCYANGMSEAVAEVLRSAMQNERWHENDKLIRFISQHVAQLAANGEGDVWSSWLSTQPPPEITFKHVWEQQRTFDMTKKMLPPSAVPSFEDWREKQLNTSLLAVSSFTVEDAEPAGNLRLYLGADEFQELVITKVLTMPNPVAMLRLLYKASRWAVLGDEASRLSFEIPTFKRLIPTLSGSFKLSFDSLAMLKDSENSASLYLPYKTTLEVSATVVDFLGVVGKCMSNKLKNEARDLLAAGLPELPSPAVKDWDWRGMIVFLKALVELMQAHNHADLKEVFQRFLMGAIRKAATHLAISKPKEPRDWCRPNGQNLNCSCGPCGMLKEFLNDPMRQVARFSYAEKTRKHLQYSLYYSDFKFETEKGRTPHTLVIHKTNTEYHRTLEEWKKDVAEFRTNLAKLQNAYVSNVLGQDIVIVSGLDEALNGMNVYLTRPLKPSSRSAQNVGRPTVAAGMKRKADVIDLTEDDPPL